jgi:hypothetical protein
MLCHSVKRYVAYHVYVENIQGIYIEIHLQYIYQSASNVYLYGNVSTVFILKSKIILFHLLYCGILFQSSGMIAEIESTGGAGPGEKKPAPKKGRAKTPAKGR